MKICFTIDDVIRAKTTQFGKIYKKYINPEIDLETLDFSSGNLKKIFNFKSDKEYNDFLYKDYAFEIFAEATPTDRMVDKLFNVWLLALSENDDLKEEVEVLWANPREFNISIGYTYFFLSQIATRVRKAIFPKDYAEIWNECDVLVTADKNLLNEKPEGKISVKIKMPYNEDCGADFTYGSLSELIKDDKFVTGLFDKKTDEKDDKN